MCGSHIEVFDFLEVSFHRGNDVESYIVTGVSIQLTIETKCVAATKEDHYWFDTELRMRNLIKGHNK